MFVNVLGLLRIDCCVAAIISLKIIADGIDVDAGINIKHQCLHETRLTNNICVKVYDIIMILDKIL